jgi:hypothetical protein
MIEFDPVRHEYWEGGVRLPSVTEILKRVNLIDKAGFSREAAAFGSAIHEASALIDRGEKTLENYATFDTYKYLEAWCLFKEHHRVQILEIERILGSVEVGCAGTIDRLALVEGLLCVVDLKSGKEKPWHSVQLAGYVYAMQGHCARVAVYLTRHGWFTLEQFQEDRDGRVFKGSLDFINKELAAGHRI